MGFLYLVEQQHGVGRLADGICQQSTVLIAHIARWRTNQLGYGVLLRVFAHVETYQFDAHLLGQHPCHLCLSHTCGTHKQ